MSCPDCADYGTAQYLSACEARVTKPDGASSVIPGLPTWSDARGWINEQIQIAMKTASASEVP
jgi:hypothetical protein